MSEQEQILEDAIALVNQHIAAERFTRHNDDLKSVVKRLRDLQMWMCTAENGTLRIGQ